MELTSDEKKVVMYALDVHKAEVKKLMTKAEKLGLKEAGDLKLTFLRVDVLRAKIAEE